MNVADEATKWHSADYLTTSRWFTGPEYLLQDSSKWPQLRKDVEDMTSEELKSEIHHIVSTSEIVTINLRYFSSYEKMVRAQSYLERAINNLFSKKNQRISGPLTSKCVEKGEKALWRRAQWDEFKQDVMLLSNNPNGEVLKSSRLLPLSPCMGDDGLVRMQGRLGRAQYLPVEMRHPVILPHTHIVAKRLIEHYHQRFNHQNHEVAINEIRQRVMIPRLRAAYRTVRSRCQWCRLRNAKAAPPKMAELPLERLLTHHKPFTIVGLDLFGPIDVVQGRSTIKCWGMIFTCLSVRAIHLEVVEDLSAKTCILAMIRFISRRGFPRKFVSDNGTNFHGAKNIFDQEKIAQCLKGLSETYYRAEWQFIPPGSPHFGGSWERLIQIVKKNLYASLPERGVSHKVLCTCFAEIEAIVNARPLTHIPVNDYESEPLTPNHFLLGSSSGYKPMCSVAPNGRVLSEDWTLTQQVAERFWQRFINEYLPELARRTKWHLRVEPLKVNDLVFVIDERNVRGTWPRGMIVQVHPGNDGQVRSAAVKMGSGKILVRPATKLAIIDIKPTDDQSISGACDPETVDQGEECEKTA